MSNPGDEYIDHDPMLTPRYSHCVFCRSDIDLAVVVLQAVKWRERILDGEYMACEPCRLSQKGRE